jgi:hypothetical protein
VEGVVLVSEVETEWPIGEVISLLVSKVSMGLLVPRGELKRSDDMRADSMRGLPCSVAGLEGLVRVLEASTSM